MERKDFKWVLNNFECILGVACSITMVCLIFLQVVSRYIFQNSISWSEELAIIFFICSIYFGACGAILKNQHIRMEIVINLLGIKMKGVVKIVSNVFFAVFMAILAQAMGGIVLNMYKIGLKTAVTQIPRWIIYALILFSFLLILVRLVQDSVNTFREIRGNSTKEVKK